MTQYPQVYQFCPMCGAAYSELSYTAEASRCAECHYQVFENLNTTASALIMRKDHQEILLVQRAHEPQKGFWDIPGGFCNPTEHPQETLHREVMEELGITVDIEKLWNVYAPIPYLYQNTIRYNCDVFYLATLRSGTPTPADDVAGFQWFALSDVPPRNLLAFESGKKALEELLSSNREGKI